MWVVQVAGIVKLIKAMVRPPKTGRFEHLNGAALAVIGEAGRR